MRDNPCVSSNSHAVAHDLLITIRRGNYMRKSILFLVLAILMLFSAVAPPVVHAATHRYHSYSSRAHRKTIKRVGIGAAGGAAIGALAGGGKGAGIGALAGAGAGYLYDRHKKRQGRP
jgi:uncharacterized membrane protein